MNIALLIGRDGSEGYPGKNTAKIVGRPFAAYPILAAQHAEGVDEVYLSTNSPTLKALARTMGVHVIDRPAELATTKALAEDAFAHAYKHVRYTLGKPVDIAVLLFCNGATVLSSHINEGIRKLKADPTLDSAVTVSRYNMWSPIRARRRNTDGLIEPFVALKAFGDLTILNCDRDSQGDVLFADMSASVVRAHCLEDLNYGILPQRWMGQKIAPIENWGGCDVDYEWQAPGVEFWLRKHGFTETSTPYDRKVPPS